MFFSNLSGPSAVPKRPLRESQVSQQWSSNNEDKSIECLCPPLFSRSPHLSCLVGSRGSWFGTLHNEVSTGNARQTPWEAPAKAQLGGFCFLPASNLCPTALATTGGDLEFSGGAGGVGGVFSSHHSQRERASCHMTDTHYPLPFYLSGQQTLTSPYWGLALQLKEEEKDPCLSGERASSCSSITGPTWRLLHWTKPALSKWRAMVIGLRPSSLFRCKGLSGDGEHFTWKFAEQKSHFICECVLSGLVIDLAQSV